MKNQKTKWLYMKWRNNDNDNVQWNIWNENEMIMIIVSVMINNEIIYMKVSNGVVATCDIEMISEIHYSMINDNENDSNN